MIGIKEIISNGIESAWEDQSYYYIKPDSDDQYDHTLWKVNKNDFLVKEISMIEFMANELSNSNTIDVSLLKKYLSE